METNNDNANATQTANPTANPNRLPVYNLIILDKSGSMHSVRREAVDAYNETLGTIKAAQQKYADSQDQYVTLALFCGCGIDKVYDRVPVAEAEPMEYDRFSPCCCTPLFDAIGTTISQLKTFADAQGDYAALVTIITDGYENASKEWTGPAVKSLIDQCRADGWMVSFIGAMEDADQVAISISIKNVIHWEKTHEGTRAMSRRESDSRGRFMARLKANYDICSDSDMSIEERKKSRSSLSDTYYDPDNENEKPE